MVKRRNGTLEAKAQIAVVDQLLNSLFLQQAVDEGHLLRQVIVENHASHSGGNELAFEIDRCGVRDVLIIVGGSEIDHLAGVAQTDGRKQFDFARLQSEHNLFHRTEGATLAFGSRLCLGQIIDAEDHILGRHGQGQAIGGRQNVARR